MTYGEVEITEVLKLTISTYKWGKCINIVKKYLLKVLYNKDFQPHPK